MGSNLLDTSTQSIVMDVPQPAWLIYSGKLETGQL